MFLQAFPGAPVCGVTSPSYRGPLSNLIFIFSFRECGFSFSFRKICFCPSGKPKHPYFRESAVGLDTFSPACDIL